MADRFQSFQRTPNTQNASWFLDLNDSGKLELDPPYQRRSVWSPSYRQFFVDSIIRNYPTQAIFLDLTLDPDRPSIYRVLDGKQRLTTLIEFTKDAFPTPDSLTDLRVDGLYYSDLPRDVKSMVLRYLFTVETVSEVTNAELNQAFDRLNRNVSRLNKQELRHAKFGGAFITKMERLARNDFWATSGLITDARSRRMLDVEYVSEFYILCLRGIQDAKDYLDEIYADYDEEIPGEEEADKLFRKVRLYLEELNAEFQISAGRFRNAADFYSLWAAVALSIQQSEQLLPPEEASTVLREFQTELEAQRSRRARSTC